MSDINISVGLNTSDALRDSKVYIKSLNDIIAVGERLEKQTASLNKTLGTSPTQIAKVATAEKKLSIAAKEARKHQEALAKAMNASRLKDIAKAKALVATSDKAIAKSAKEAMTHENALAKAMNAARLKVIAKDKKAVARANKTMAKAAKDARKHEEALAKAMNSDRLRAKASRLRSVADETRRLTTATKKQSAALKSNANAWGVVRRLILAYVGINAAKSIISTVSAFDSLEASLGIVSKNSILAGQNMEFITSESRRLGIGISGAGKEFVKLSAAAKGSTIQGKGVRDIFTGIAEASRALNLSADDTSGAFRAITQIMSKGTVQAEELRGQLGERFPGAFQTAARAIGVTTAELNKMLELGEVISEDFLPKFIKQVGIDIPLSAASLKTVSAEFGKLGTEVELLVRILGDNGLAEAVRSVTKELTAFIKSGEAADLARRLGESMTDLGSGIVKLLKNLPAIANGFASLLDTISDIAPVLTFMVENVGDLIKVWLVYKAVGIFNFIRKQNIALAVMSSTLTGSVVKGLTLAAAAASTFAKSFGVVGLVIAGVSAAMLVLGAIKFGPALLNSLFGTDKEIEDKKEKLLSVLTETQDAVGKAASMSANFERLAATLGTFIMSDTSSSNLKEFLGEVEEEAQSVRRAISRATAQMADFTNKKLSAETPEQLAIYSAAINLLRENLTKLNKNLVDSAGIVELVNSKLGKTNHIDKYKSDLRSMSIRVKKTTDQLKKKLAPSALVAAKALLKLAKTSERLATGKQRKKLMEYIDALEIELAKLKKIEDQAKATANAKANKKVIEALEFELELMSMTNDEAMLAINLDKLRGNGLKDEIKLVTELTDKILAKNKAMDTKKLIKDSDKVGDAWLKVGNNLEGVFGGIVDQLNAMSRQSREFTDQHGKNQKRLDEINADSAAGKAVDTKEQTTLIAAQGRLEDRNTQAKLGQMANIASAVASNAKDGSKFQKIALKAAQALQIANAIAAVASAATAPPPVGFALAGAMLGLMSSIGIAIGSGGGGGGPSISETRQESQGTGTILGDPAAKADSIANVLERIEQVDMDQFLELRGIFKEMVSLNQNIQRFSASIVRSFGDFSGQGMDIELGGRQRAGGIVDSFAFASDLAGVIGSLFGSVKKTLTDSGIKFFEQSFAEILAGGVNAVAFADIKTKKKRLFGIISSSSTNQQTSSLDDEATRQLTDIFTGMGDTITSALDILGIDAVNSLESFIVDIGEVSFKDMTGDEIQAELEAIFSQQGDMMALHVLPSLVDFQKVGEGLFETLIRVAQETASFEQGLKLIGVGLAQFSDVSGEEFLQMSQAAIDAAGGIEAYQEAVVKFSKEVLGSTNILALAASNAQMLSETELADIGLTLADIPNLDSFREAFESIKDTLSPAEIVEWVQAGNALADLDKALESFESSLSKVLKPFQDLRSEISEIISSLEGDTRTAQGVADRMADAMSAVDQLVGGVVLSSIGVGGGKGITPPIVGPIKDIFEINTDADPADQLAALDELRDAILNNHDFQMMVLEEEQAAIQSLLDSAVAFKEQVDSFLESIGDELTSLREMAPDFDKAAARAAEVQALQDQLANSVDINRENELDLLSRIKDAIMDNFQAQQDAIKNEFSERRKLLSEEMKLRRSALKIDFAQRKKDASETLSSLKERFSTRKSQESELVELQQRLQEVRLETQQKAAQSAFDSAQALFEAWNSAAQELTSFLDTLQLSDVSPLTNQERLSFAESRFETLLARAQSGDSNAAQELAGASSDFLQEARSFFASSPEFTEIFNRVQEQTTGVRDIAAAVREPSPLAVGDQAIVESVGSVEAQIAALTLTMEPISSQDLAGQIEAQEALIAQISLDEKALLLAISEEEKLLLRELNTLEAAALEQLRLETIAQLEPLALRAEELNRLVQEDIVTHQEALLSVELRMETLTQETVNQLISLNATIEQLEEVMESSAREEFDALIESNTANTDRIIDAIITGGLDPTVPQIPGGTPEGGGAGGGGFGDTNEGQTPDIFGPGISKTLESIDNTLKGGGGGAVFQNNDEGIESI